MYLCYDIKGIQQFIFSVPRLRYIVGASSIIAEFDEFAKNKFEKEHVFCGGGKGAFECGDRQRAEVIRDVLVSSAHEKNLDLRIGIQDNFADACEKADELYPYCPDDLSGFPCKTSGIWPVGKDGVEGEHRGIYERGQEGRDFLRDMVWKFRQHDLQRAFPGYVIDFFRTANPSEEDNPKLVEKAKASQRALGNRNRWAIVAMDGNDMGKQFHEMKNRGVGDAALLDWVKSMSRAIADVTQTAFLNAVSSVAVKWGEDMGDQVKCCVVGDRLILPFRPLVLGGDDLIIICHSAYARMFVEQMCKEFEEGSRNTDDPNYLWPATNGKLEMSAGILYVKSTFPLHMAIPYAESLLASAKGMYRHFETTPAAIDFDVVTDTLLDTPAERRHRELVFNDKELDEDLGQRVQLTRRPYLLKRNGNYPCLEDLNTTKKTLDQKKFSNSIRARILSSLQRPWSERYEYLSSIRKFNPTLCELLDEDKLREPSTWRPLVKNDGTKIGRCTGLPDALMLLEEEHRLESPTVESEA